MPRALIMTLAIMAASATAALGQDAQKGKIVFHRCLPCHSIGSDAESTIGPELNGLEGRPAGTAPNYDYRDSGANKNSGIVWTEATFNEYMKDPQATIPGTKMIFPGVRNQQDVNDLWAYVKQFNADGTKKNSKSAKGGPASDQSSCVRLVSAAQRPHPTALPAVVWSGCMPASQ
jgi:cytochrome c